MPFFIGRIFDAVFGDAIEENFGPGARFIARLTATIATFDVGSAALDAVDMIDAADTASGAVDAAGAASTAYAAADTYDATDNYYSAQNSSSSDNDSDLHFGTGFNRSACGCPHFQGNGAFCSTSLGGCGHSYAAHAA